MTTRPSPASAPEPSTLPSAVTFFLSAGQRRRVLAALRAIDHDRTRALLAALGVHEKTVKNKG